jgi:hypothetical protein
MVLVNSQVKMVHEGRILLGDVRSVYYDDVSFCTRLRVCHFNGELWPVFPREDEVMILERTFAAPDDEPVAPLRMTLATPMREIAIVRPRRGFTPTSDVITAAEQLLDEALTRLHDHVSEETFTQCEMCGEVDSHTDDCPVPALEKWMSTP